MTAAYRMFMSVMLVGTILLLVLCIVAGKWWGAASALCGITSATTGIILTRSAS